MKKFLALFLVFTLLAALAGCRAFDRAEDVMEHKMDAVEDAAEQAVAAAINSNLPAASPAESAAPDTQANAEPAPAPDTQKPAGPITEDQAKAIALDHAGVSEQDTTRLHIREDWDDGRQEYDVEFHVGYVEYEYEIDLNTGKILSFDKDR